MRTLAIAALLILSFMLYALGLGVLIIFTLIGIGALCKPGHDGADDIHAALFGILVAALIVAGLIRAWALIVS